MYFWLAVVGTLGYSLQNILLVGVFRRVDTLVGTAMRGVSLGITMLPLLYFVADLPQQFSSWDLFAALGAASLLAAVGNWCSYQSYRYLPVGVSISCGVGMMTVSAVLLDQVFFGHQLRLLQLVAVAGVVAGNALLGIFQKRGESAGYKFSAWGLVCCASGGVLLAFAYMFVARASRSHDPLLAAYLWEIGIGSVALCLALVRRLVRTAAPVFGTWRDFRDTLIGAAPTLIGTSCYALAVVRGPMGVVMAIMSATIVVTAVIARFCYHERLAAIQWAAVGVVFLSIVGLRLG